MRRRSTWMIIIGILLLLAAGVLVFRNMQESAEAGEASDSALTGLEEAMPSEDTWSIALPTLPEEGTEMTTVEVDGYTYIGRLEIPSLELSLPVMKDWDYNKLNISPCRYSGSYLSDDMVICAHNFASHFGAIHTLAIGAEVDFITTEGRVYRYSVSNIETLQPTMVSEMMGLDEDLLVDEEKGWELTLFTCTVDGRARHAVRCIRQ